MKKEKVFVITFYKEFECATTFKYMVCDTKEAASAYIVDQILQATQNKKYFECDNMVLDRDLAIVLAKLCLTDNNFVVCDGYYYSIQEVELKK